MSWNILDSESLRHMVLVCAQAFFVWDGQMKQTCKIIAHQGAHIEMIVVGDYAINAGDSALLF